MPDQVNAIDGEMVSPPVLVSLIRLNTHTLSPSVCNPHFSYIVNALTRLIVGVELNCRSHRRQLSLVSIRHTVILAVVLTLSKYSRELDYFQQILGSLAMLIPGM